MFWKKIPKTETDEGAIQTLLSRGVEKIFPSAEVLGARLLRGERVSLYLGIDPTGPTLHLGHAIVLKKLRDFQKMGHAVTLLIGDFTAMIGDPTGKSAARKQLTRQEVIANARLYKKQASRFIAFQGKNKATLTYNSRWLSRMRFTDVLKLAAHMTVEQMQKRDMFVERAKKGNPVFIHEFLYPLMQGYDSVALGVDGEIGGNDQTFNMLTGRHLAQAMTQKDKFVVSMKLLTDTAGAKMGKTDDNAVALTDNPESIYGKVMSWGDEIIIPAFELCTDVTDKDIKEAEAKLTNGENPKILKQKLAFEIVKTLSGEKAARAAEEHFTRVFGEKKIPEDTPEISVAPNGSFGDAFLQSKLFISKSEVRRLAEGGAIENMETKEKVKDLTIPATAGTYRIGPRRFVRIRVA